MFTGEPGVITSGLADTVARLPVNTARGFLVGGLPQGEHADQKQRYHAAFEKFLALTKAMYDAKLTLVAGTDHIAGVMLLHELELFARAGIPNADVLRIATLGAARTLDQANAVGSIAKGKRADLVLIDGDPLARIADLARVHSTMRAGVLFDSAAVYRTVSVKPLLTELAPPAR
jgi:imidazolonepropionase-like amidohydrolase